MAMMTSLLIACTYEADPFGKLHGNYQCECIEYTWSQDTQTGEITEDWDTVSIILTLHVEDSTYFRFRLGFFRCPVLRDTVSCTDPWTIEGSIRIQIVPATGELEYSDDLFHWPFRNSHLCTGVKIR